MKSWIKIGFIISVMLNVLLIASLILGRNYVKRTNFELAAMTAKAEANLAKSLLGTLSTEAPEGIKKLKERLRTIADQGEKTAEIWNSAAKK